MIKDSTGADTEGVGTSGEAEKSTLALIDDAKASPSLSTDREAGGSGSARTRIIPFQSLPTSIQEELGKDLFDDPLLTPENMKKL